jgi:hypothetical protein
MERTPSIGDMRSPPSGGAAEEKRVGGSEIRGQD